MDSIVELEKKIKALLLKASHIKITTALGLPRLRASCIEKEKILTEVATELSVLGGCTSDRNLLNNLRRRLSQQQASNKGFAMEATLCVCYNSHAFSWEMAALKLEQFQSRSIFSPLSFVQLFNLLEVLENELALSAKNVLEIVEHTDISISIGKLIEQTARLLPVMWLHAGHKAMVINIHEMILDGEVVEKLLSLDSVSDDTVDLTSPQTNSTCTPVSTGSKTRGRPSLISQFPQIPDLVTDFLKQHGFAAHSRRRSGIGSTCGVSLEDIRKHLLAKIPQLGNKGIGKTT